jgi:transcriptional antiterminator RfaH
MPAQWYALKSKPNKEDALWHEVSARGYEVFYPQIRVQPVNPRSRKLRAYFPGYMFLHVDIEAVGISNVSWIPHSNGLVTFGEDPATVPEGLVHALQRRLEQVNAAGGEVMQGLRQGDTVVIQDGPFAGYEAVFDARVSGNERVRVLLQLLRGQQKAVVLSPGHLRKKK